jgi:hypothetical protein
METTARQSTATPTEIRSASIGFILVGLGVAVTAVSYVLNMTFPLQWLVWTLGAAFAAVALLAFEWPRSFRRFG